MKKYFLNIIILLIASLAITFNAYSADITLITGEECYILTYGGDTLYNSCESELGASVTTMDGGDTLKDSRAVINTNITNLNTDKLDSYDIVGGAGIGWSSTTAIITFDCSEVEGTGINCSGENITLDATGAWTGTFDGQQGTYYSDADNLTDFGNPFYTYFNATSTDALSEGSNLYWTNTRFDNRLSATNTLPNITTLLGLTDATTTKLTISGLTNCDTIDTDASGNLSCGTDASGDIAQLGQIGDVSTSSPMTYGELLIYNTATSEWDSVATSTLGLGGSADTVSSVAMSVPTGLTITGSPITTSGTLALTLTGGYQMLTDVASTTWDTAYTHISNDGSDHSFIDQSVISGASPTFDNANITGNISVYTNDSGFLTSVAQLGQIGDVSTTTLATGYTLHYDGSNWMSTSTLFVNADTGCVGIGTTTTCCKLCVDGSIRTTDTFYGNTWTSYDGNSMNIKPSGDEDDFFSFKTIANRPTWKREGGKFIYCESSNVYDVGISFRDDDTYSGTLNYEKDGHMMTMLGKASPLGFKANSDYDDYIKIQTANNIPEITVASSSALKINAGGTNSLLLNHDGGNVGIGTTSPLSIFSMNSGTNGFRIDSSGIVQQGTWQGTALTDAYVSNTLTVDGYMQDGDINTFSELQSWVSDETLLKAGTLTDTKYCIYDSASGDIICNSEGGGSSFSSIATLNALMTGESVASTSVATLSSLTSIGTIGTGVWQGTDVGVQYGGTGASSLTDGYILLGSGTGAITPLDLTAKGSLIVGDGTTDPIALTVGSDDKVLTASSTTSSGLAWETAAAGGGGDVGGLYGMNVETLSADKTLTVDSNKIYQYLDEGGANRIITLATAGASAGDRFVVRHNGAYWDTNYLQIKQSTTILDQIYTGAIKEFIFDGTNWISGENGTGENDDKKRNITIGMSAIASSEGVAIGKEAKANSAGTAIGYTASAINNGIAIGNDAYGGLYGIAIGNASDGYDYGIAFGALADTNQKKYSIAFGRRSQTKRTSEIAKNIDGSSTQDYNMSSAGWAMQTANATPVEMFLGEEANQRFTINPESVVSFTIRITARDNVANEVASYKVEGLIKRDGANNTVLSWSSKTVQYEDDASWDVAVTADDTNEALIVTVTGDGTNPVRFAGRIDEVETQF